MLRFKRFFVGKMRFKCKLTRRIRHHSKPRTKKRNNTGASIDRQSQEVVETPTEVGTDLFAAHGLKHFLQLDSKLLDVVEDDAGLQEKNMHIRI